MAQQQARKNGYRRETELRTQVLKLTSLLEYKKWRPKLWGRKELKSHQILFWYGDSAENVQWDMDQNGVAAHENIDCICYLNIDV